MSIYSNFIPTFLYIKQHNITKLKYFGKTTRPLQEMLLYQGSGKYWVNHLVVHGNDISTIWYRQFNNPDSLFYFATVFSEANNIIKSNEWANLIIETGFQGGGSKFSPLAIQKAIEKRILLYGNGFGQCHNKNTVEKAQTTYITKYGNLMSCCHTNEAKEKRIKTMIEKYGENFDPRMTTQSREKARNTKNQKYFEKENVVKLLSLSKSLGVKLGRNWFYKDDEWINSKIKELSI